MTEPILQVVAVLILKDDRVLLVRHIHSKHIENIYGLPGGKLEQKETEPEGARRELEEETGLVTKADELQKLPTLWKAEVTFKDGSVRTCSMRVFLCKGYRGTTRDTPHELSEWVPIKTLASLSLLPNVQEAVIEGLSFL